MIVFVFTDTLLGRYSGRRHLQQIELGSHLKQRAGIGCVDMQVLHIGDNFPQSELAAGVLASRDTLAQFSQRGRFQRAAGHLFSVYQRGQRFAIHGEVLPNSGWARFRESRLILQTMSLLSCPSCKFLSGDGESMAHPKLLSDNEF